jgi:hypothetical protein
MKDIGPYTAVYAGMAFAWSEGKNTGNAVIQQVYAARDMGTRGVMLFHGAAFTPELLDALRQQPFKHAAGLPPTAPLLRSHFSNTSTSYSLSSGILAPPEGRGEVGFVVIQTACDLHRVEMLHVEPESGLGRCQRSGIVGVNLAGEAGADIDNAKRFAPPRGFFRISGRRQQGQ